MLWAMSTAGLPAAAIAAASAAPISSIPSRQS